MVEIHRKIDLGALPELPMDMGVAAAGALAPWLGNWPAGHLPTTIEKKNNNKQKNAVTG